MLNKDWGFERMPTYNFLIEMTSVGKGYIEADSIEQARELIKSGELCNYGDIYDEVDSTIGDLIEIYEE